MLRGIFSILLVCAVVTNTTAQNTDKHLESHTKEKIAMMNRYIAYMADPRNSESTRFAYREEAQNMFINECNKFTEIIEYKNGERDTIQREGVAIQVTSPLRNTPQIKLIKDYFRGLIKLNYKSVKIGSTDIADIRISNLQPYGEDENGNPLYVCSIFFDQVFIGVTPEGRKYQDIAHKWVVCNVQVDEVLDETTGETHKEYMYSLGDVHVDSLEKLW